MTPVEKLKILLSGFTTERIIQFLIAPQFPVWLNVLKIIFIIFSFILLSFIVFALIKTTWLKRLIIWDIQEFLTYRPFGLRKIEKQWQKIKKKLENNTDSEWKLAVIEADKLMNNILNRMGFEGETLGDRLKNLSVTSLPNIEEIKEAHKIRSNIVHDPSYRLNLEEAKKTVAIYEKALIDLHAL